MAEYNSAYTGTEIDSAIGRVLSSGDTWDTSVKLIMRTVTLTATSWSNNQQTVDVPGVLADEGAQVIIPIPAATSESAYSALDIKATVPSDNKMTFTRAAVVNFGDITVYVAIIGN